MHQLFLILFFLSLFSVWVLSLRSSKFIEEFVELWKPSKQEVRRLRLGTANKAYWMEKYGTSDDEARRILGIVFLLRTWIRLSGVATLVFGALMYYTK